MGAFKTAHVFSGCTTRKLVGRFSFLTSSHTCSPAYMTCFTQLSGSVASEHLFFRLYNSETIMELCNRIVDFPTVQLDNYSDKCSLLSRL